MNMDTLTLWQAVADYRTRLAGFGFVVMICLGLPVPVTPKIKAQMA